MRRRAYTSGSPDATMAGGDVADQDRVVVAREVLGAPAAQVGQRPASSGTSSSHVQSSPANLSSASRSAKRVRQRQLVATQHVHAEVLAGSRARRGSASRARPTPAATAGARCRRRATVAASPHGRPSGAARGDHRHAGGQVRSWPRGKSSWTGVSPVYSHARSAALAAGPHQRMHAVERGVGSGLVDALVGAAALLARQAGGARSGGRAGRGRRAARAGRRRRAAGRRGARARRACSSGGRRGQPRSAGRRRRAGGSGSAAARASAARRPNTKHSASEFDASRLAPCRPVQAHSPTA